MSTVSHISAAYVPVSAVAGSSDGISTSQAAESSVQSSAGSQDSQDSYVNPQIQVDSLSGVVILQYRDDAGKVVRQMPSEYELRSYQATPHNSKPAGRTDGGSAALGATS